jgi:hypothetical protein
LTKKYDRPATPHRRADAYTKVTAEDKAIMADTLGGLNPAAVQRQIQALTAELLTLTTSKAAAGKKPAVPRRPDLDVDGGRGEHNPRDFAKYVWHALIPLFDSTDPLHRQLVELGRRATEIAATVRTSPPIVSSAASPRPHNFCRQRRAGRLGRHGRRATRRWPASLSSRGPDVGP